jgi:hypothetical protein
MPEHKLFSFDWALWFLWIMATTLGWLVTNFLAIGVSYIAAGFAISLLQGFVLQGRISRTFRWVVAGTIGWAVGWLIVLLAIPNGLEIINGVVVGLAMGIAGWLVLRREVHWAGWWIVLSGVGWTTGLALVPGFLSTGSMAGALTGLALGLLLRNPLKTAASNKSLNGVPGIEP